MADYIPPGDCINLYQYMPELRREVYNQRTQCCWAIAVATAVGYTYGINEHAPEVKVSPQDILDRVWFYSSEEERQRRVQDRWGGFVCRNTIAYRYVNGKGARLERDCPFENSLNMNRGEVLTTEVPRMYCTPYVKLDLQGAVKSILNNVPVTASVKVTAAFKTYKQQGVYRMTPGADIYGNHSVVIVGVNVEENYFLIRNSWGVEWGYEGYGLIHFNSIRKFTCAFGAWMEHYPRINN